MSFIAFNKEIVTKKELNFYEVERFRYADSFFETMYYDGHRLPLKEFHLERIHKTLAFFEAAPFTFNTYVFEKLLSVNNQLNYPCKVRLSFVRESGENYKPLSNHFHTLMEIDEFPEPFRILNNVGVFANNHKEDTPNAMFKTGNALTYVLAKKYAAEQNLDDVLIANAKNQLIEASSSAFVIIKEGLLIAPSRNAGQIDSVSLAYLKSTFEINEKELYLQDIEAADELFLCNAVQFIKPVMNFMGKPKTNNQTNQIINHIKGDISFH